MAVSERQYVRSDRKGREYPADRDERQGDTVNKHTVGIDSAHKTVLTSESEGEVVSTVNTLKPCSVGAFVSKPHLTNPGPVQEIPPAPGINRTPPSL